MRPGAHTLLGIFLATQPGPTSVAASLGLHQPYGLRAGVLRGDLPGLRAAGVGSEQRAAVLSLPPKQVWELEAGLTVVVPG